MADLSIEFAGIKAPTCSGWPARRRPTRPTTWSAPSRPAGAAWSGNPGEDPAAVNVSSRYSAHFGPNRQAQGINNIELITDRPLEINLREITQVKKDWPGPRDDRLADGAPASKNPGNHPAAGRGHRRDGIELNFGCPTACPRARHGRGGGQVPEYIEMVTRWCKTIALPVIVKLTPTSPTSACPPAAHRRRRRRCGVADQHHQLDHQRRPRPHGRPAHRSARQAPTAVYVRFGGQADRLNMVAEIARDPETPARRSAVSAASALARCGRFVALGCGTVQVCTAAMLHGFRIVEEMKDGLSRWMDSRACQPHADFSGPCGGQCRTDWKYLDINYQVIARSTRTPASAAAAAISPAKTPRTRPSPA